MRFAPPPSGPPSPETWHLRDALWKAGIVPPLDRFEEAHAAWRKLVEADDARTAEAKRTKKARRWAERRAARVIIDAAEEKARACCLIQAGSSELKPLDFYSFRRQFNTGLAAIGLNVQQAMALAGHKSTTTHMAYVQLAQHGALETPFAAMPVLVQAGPLPFALPPRTKTARKSARPSRRV
ncbi:MAG: hypothetical protein ABIQ16_17335 [Polyangiaceae bacterium]